jgi:hypothetical protein
MYLLDAIFLFLLPIMQVLHGIIAELVSGRCPSNAIDKLAVESEWLSDAYIGMARHRSTAIRAKIPPIHPIHPGVSLVIAAQ